MQTVIDALAIYFFLMLVMRIAGKRTLRENSTFDLVLLLIISETTQNAMVHNDHSLVTAFILILTLVFTDILLSLLKQKIPSLRRIVEPLPVVLILDGEKQSDVMAKARVDEDDILSAARRLRGLQNIDEIKHAVLEQDGEITVIAKGRSDTAVTEITH